jgi:NADH-quinone oxidoreductase subunit G/formate dehydrogenase alpha subunit
MTSTNGTTTRSTLTLDGEAVAFAPGETILEVARRQAVEVPTLCYDPRLDPFGGCRLCVVEIDGVANPVASCARAAEDGMVVHSSSPTLDKHRKTLLEMVCSENRQVDVDPLSGYASQELADLADRYDARSGRFAGNRSGTSRDDDDNPFILRDYDQCISCYRCVRVCAEQEGDYAISIKGRGFGTQITVEFDGLLKDSACTFCGQCVQTCPTGALADKKALRAAEVPGDFEKTRSICTYCGVGCSVDILTKDERVVGVQPAMDGPANLGALCVKGQFAFDFVHHEDRLTTPLMRGEDGELHEASWDDALDFAAKGFLEARDKHGRESVYAVASGRAPHEAAYTTQRFIRAGFWTNHVDNCSRA